MKLCKDRVSTQDSALSARKSVNAWPKPFATEKFEKKWLMKLCKGSRVEFSTQDSGTSSKKTRKRLKAQTLATTEKFEKKWPVKLCKDRLSRYLVRLCAAVAFFSPKHQFWGLIFCQLKQWT